MSLEYKVHGWDYENDCQKLIPIVTEDEIDLFIKYKYNNQKNIRMCARSKIIQIKREFKIDFKDYLKLTKECAICGFPELISIHHIIPKFEGGTDTLDNYIGLCFNCHKLYHLKRWSLDEIRDWYKKQRLNKNDTV